MNLSFWLVLCCSVALSNSFETEFDIGACLGGDLAETKLKAMAHYALMAWNGIVPLNGKITAENESKLELLTTLNAFQTIYDFVEVECEIGSEKFESFMLICAPLTIHYQNIISYLPRLHMDTVVDGATTGIDGAATVMDGADTVMDGAKAGIDGADTEKIIGAIDQIEIIKNRMLKELKQFYSEYCEIRNSNKYNELISKIDGVYKMDLAIAPQNAGYIPTTPLKAALYLVFITWNRALRMWKIFTNPICDSIRPIGFLMRYNFAYFLETFLNCIEPNSKIKATEYNSIASKCERLGQHSDNINHSWAMQAYRDANDGSIIWAIGQGGLEITFLIEEIMYELLQLYPQIRQHDDTRRTVLLGRRMVWPLIAMGTSPKATFVQMIIPISDFFLKIGIYANPLNRAFSQFQLLVATGYHFAMDVFTLFADYLMADLEWQSNTDAQKKIQEQSAAIFIHMPNLDIAINNFHSGPLAATDDADQQVRANIASFLIRNFTPVATQLYKTVESLFELLPSGDEALDTRRKQYDGFIKRLRECGEL